MRPSVVAAALGLGLLASDGAARADRSVEDWVGTWTGDATWKDCSAPGDDHLAMTVTWRDGALWIAAGAIYEGLGEVAPEERSDGALVHDQSDLTIEVRKVAAKKSKKKARKAKAGAATATVRLTTAAQCTMTARIARAQTGITSCDDLVALASAATGCGVALDDDPALEVEAWSGLAGKKRTAAAEGCQLRATELREQLVAKECLSPDGDPSLIAECRDTWKLAQRLLRCDRAPVEYKQSTMESITSLKRSLRSLHDSEGGAEIAAATCVETSEMLRTMVEALACQ